MKWISFIKDNKQSVGILKDEKIIPLYEYKDINDVLILENKEYKELLDEINNYFNDYIDVNDVTIVSPIGMPFQDILCVGFNYMDHIVEANQYEKESFKKPEFIVYFSKRVNQVVSYLEDVSCHKNKTNKFDYETEVGVILKEDCRNCTKENVREKIFGYTVVNDYSARDIQTSHQQWYLGKSLDGMFSMGPYILSGNIDPDNLEIKTYVNDELRQDSSTKYMIKSIDEIIVELSNYMTLKKGTIIATGTPSGVGMGFKPPKFLKEGDVVISKIEKLGYIKNKIV